MGGGSRARPARCVNALTRFPARRGGTSDRGEGESFTVGKISFTDGCHGVWGSGNRYFQTLGGGFAQVNRPRCAHTRPGAPTRPSRGGFSVSSCAFSRCFFALEVKHFRCHMHKRPNTWQNGLTGVSRTLSPPKCAVLLRFLPVIRAYILLRPAAQGKPSGSFSTPSYENLRTTTKENE